MMIIDGLQYCNWSRTIFQQMITGGVRAVHATIAYHENCRETLYNIGNWNRMFEAHKDIIMPAYSAKDIERAHTQNKVGIIFGFQNCSPIEDDIALIEIFYQLGVRFMQLTYNNQSLLATGCYETTDPGITRFGKAVIEEMNRVGMVIDMSHSGEESTLQAIALSQRPIAISHANPMFFHEVKRNKSRRVLSALAESEGLLGCSLYPLHLKDNSECVLEHFCAMIADTVDLMGIQSVGIGSDLCQNQPLSVLEWMRNGRWNKKIDGEKETTHEGATHDRGWPKPLSWFQSNADFPNIITGLRQKGFTHEEIEKIMGQNWLAFFQRNFDHQKT